MLTMYAERFHHGSAHKTHCFCSKTEKKAIEQVILEMSSGSKAKELKKKNKILENRICFLQTHSLSSLTHTLYNFLKQHTDITNNIPKAIFHHYFPAVKQCVHLAIHIGAAQNFFAFTFPRSLAFSLSVWPITIHNDRYCYFAGEQRANIKFSFPWHWCENDTMAEWTVWLCLPCMCCAKFVAYANKVIIFGMCFTGAIITILNPVADG